MVKTSYRIVKGKKVKTKKQKEREKSSSYRRKLERREKQRRLVKRGHEAKKLIAEEKREKQRRLVKRGHEAKKLIAEEKRKQKDVKKEVKPSKPIRLEKEKKGFIKESWEKPIGHPASLKTTAALGAGLAGLGVAAGVGAGAVATGGTAVITRTATQLFPYGKTLTTQRAFVGRSATSGIDKIFHKVRPVAARYASNTKSAGLTKSWLVRLGITAFIAKQVADLYGTFPFASFGKEETLQSISFPLTKAIDAGDFEGAQRLLDASNEIVNALPTIADKIPYVNVQKEFQRYIKTQKIANIEWQRIIDIKSKELSGETETKFSKERRLSDEAARERVLAYRKEDEEYYDEIEKQRQEDKAAGRTEDAEYYRKIAEENRARKLKEREEDEAYYAQFR